MFTKRLSFLAPLLLALGCAFCAACSPGARQSETAGNDSTAAAKPAPLPQDGKGTARLIPNAPIVVNTHGTWKIVFTVGREGISAGGGIAVHISPYRGTIRFVPSAAAVTIPDGYAFTPSDKGVCKVQCTITQPGLYYITAEDKESGFTRVSNPVQCTDKPRDYNPNWKLSTDNRKLSTVRR